MTRRTEPPMPRPMSVADEDQWIRFVEAAQAHYWPWLADMEPVEFPSIVNPPRLGSQSLMGFKLRCGLHVAAAFFLARMKDAGGAPCVHLVGGVSITSKPEGQGAVRLGEDAADAYRWAGTAVIPRVPGARWEYAGESRGVLYFRIPWDEAGPTARAAFCPPSTPQSIPRPTTTTTMTEQRSSAS